MSDDIRIGDRVKIYLDSSYWESEGWFDGSVVGIDRYSAHRSFYWVELDTEVKPSAGAATRRVSVLNPSRIVKA